MSTLPQALYVSASSIETYTSESWSEVERDPRGLFLMWESPEPKATYIMSCDAAEGITGWTRGFRTDGDHKKDNSAIEIFKVDGAKKYLYKEVNGQQIEDINPNTKEQRFIYQDVQVGEYAAPNDAVEIARIANLLGRIYCGNAEEQCKFIWEAWPGVGLLATQEILRLQYQNIWYWQYFDREAEETNAPGWRSTATSQRLLWYRARRHILSDRAVIRSKWLLGEYASAEVDLTKMRARAAYGYHDDRFQAANMAFWAAHEWSYDAERLDDPVTETPVLDFQKYAPTLDGNGMTYKDWRENALSDWED